jgi:hypothetical protein
MSAIRHRFLSVTAILLVRTALGAPPLAAGDYSDIDGGVGTLSIATRADGSLAFEIEADGANLHTCSVSGTIQDGASRILSPSGGGDACVIDFHAASDPARDPAPGSGPDAIEVSVNGTAENFEACRAFCGARASFDRTYFRVPSGCNTKARQDTYGAFKRAEKDKDYLSGLDILEPLQSRCGRFLGWIEQDRVHNHLALMLHGLGRDADCLRELGRTAAGSAGNEAVLNENFIGQPMSLEAYLPTAHTTWTIRRRCGGEPEIPPAAPPLGPVSTEPPPPTM